LRRFALNDICERNVLAHLLYLDGNAVSDTRFGNDHDIAALDFRDPVTLVTEILDFNVSLFTFLDRRAVVFVLLTSVVS
jgi:hypothetical protein